MINPLLDALLFFFDSFHFSLLKVGVAGLKPDWTAVLGPVFIAAEVGSG